MVENRSPMKMHGAQARRLHGLVAVVTAAALLAGTSSIITAGTAYGADLRQGDTIVVPVGETVEDDLYAFGQTVTIYGTVNGDVIAAGQSVNVAGTVNGSLMAAGSSIVVAGPVGGSARLAGQTVEVTAPVGHDLLAGAATLNVAPRATIGRDVLAGGSSVALAGPVARSIRAGAERLTIGGPVGGDVLAQAGTLRLVNGASIQGNLSYTSGQDASVEPGASVQGMTTRLEAAPAPAAPSPAARLGEAILGWLRMLVGLSAFGLVLTALFPGFMRRSIDTLVREPWPSLGLGFALLVGVPVGAVLLFVAGLLIGGWWLGPLALALYGLTLPVGCAIVGLFVGRLAMQWVGRPGVASGWSMVVGLALLGAVSLLPLAGGVAILAALMFGLGAGTLALKAAYLQQAAEAGARPPAPAPASAGDGPLASSLGM
jgi:cytoskeletal protein CcmA (bactofilin family)